MEISMLQARQAQSNRPSSPPYPPTTASLGGVPTVGVDVPISVVFLLLFLVGAIAHMTILQVNLKRGHKFIISGMLFGFCMARIVTMVMRVVWACHPRNIRVAIASQVFVAAGVVLLFVINIVFAQRIIRAAHPRFGWHPIFHWTLVTLYVIIVITLVMIITCVIQSFYTLNSNTKRIDRAVQLYGQTYYALVSFLPFPLVLGALIVPRTARIDKFGSGRWKHKITILLLSSVLLCLGATFRVGVNYAGGERSINNPAVYQSKACFYIFNFLVEILVIIAYVVVRVDRRFYVPDKSHGPGDYSRKQDDLTTETRGEGKLERVIAPEEEVFDDMSTEELAKDASGSQTDDEEKAVSPVENPTQTPAEHTNGVDIPDHAMPPQEKGWVKEDGVTKPTSQQHRETNQ